MTDPSAGRYGGPNPIGDQGGQQPQPGPGGHWQPPPIRAGRRRAWIYLAGTGAVLVTLAVVLTLTITGRDAAGGGASPADAVKGYLEALSRGDAAAALAFGDDQPASMQLLTSDVLKKQIAKLPISNIEVKEHGAPGDPATTEARAVATFGDQTFRATLTPKRKNGRWFLPSAVIRLRPNPSHSAATDTLTLFGKPLGDSVHYVFPGWMDVGSNNPYLEVKSVPQPLNALDSESAAVDAAFSVNAAGTKAIHDALAAAFAKCGQSHALRPDAPCSTAGLNPDEFVDGTAQWGPYNPSTIAQVLDLAALRVTLAGLVVVPVTVQNRAGATEQIAVKHLIHGHADLSKVPPELTFD